MLSRLSQCVVALLACQCAAATFQWDVPSDTVGIDGYELHYGESSGAYSQFEDVPGATTNTATVQDQISGTRYYAVRARNIDSTMFSTFSNEVAVLVGIAPNEPENVSVVHVEEEVPPLATVTRTVAASGADHTTIEAAFLWFTSNHNFGTDGIARIQVTDSSTYTFSSAWTITDSIPGTATSTAYLEITSNASDPFAGPTIEMTHSSGSAGWLIAEDYVYIHNLYFKLNSTLGSAEVIRINGQYDNTLISRCVFESVGTAADQDGIYAGDTMSVYIDHCVMWGFTRAALHPQVNSGSKTQDWYIDHCSIADHHGSGEADGGALSVYRNSSGTTYNINMYNTLGYNTSGNTNSNVFNEDRTNSTVNYSGSNNIAEDASVETNYTSSYDSVTFTESSPSSGENAWLTEIDTLASLDLDIAGENSFTVTDNGTDRSTSEPEARQDFSTDIMGRTRAATPDIGAFEYVAASPGDAFFGSAINEIEHGSRMQSALMLGGVLVE